MLKRDLFAEEIARDLNIKVYPIVFEDIEEDARLYFDKEYIAISTRHRRSFKQIILSIAHEYRHVFQREYIKTHDDEIAKIWRKEIEDIKNGVRDEYFSLLTEIDALAYTKYYLQTYRNMPVIIPNVELDTMVNIYICDQFYEIEKNRKMRMD